MNTNFIDLINNKIFSGNDKSMINCVHSVINYCKSLVSEITSKKNHNELKKKSLMEHMYIIYYCYKCTGVMKIISNNKVCDDIDSEIEKYLEDFYSKESIVSICELLMRDAKYNKNNDECFFYTNIIKKCFEEQKYPDIKTKIKKNIMQINTLLKKEENITVTPKIKKYINKKEKFKLDRKTYYYLQRKIKNPDDRKEIENIYFNKSIKCLGLLEYLILLRTEYANKLGYKTYFQCKNKNIQNESGEIINLMNDLITKIDTRSKKEVIRIKNKLSEDGYKKKVEFHDMIYYYEELCSKCHFSLSDVLKELFAIIKKNFYLEFKPVEQNNNMWTNDIMTYEVIDRHNNKLGYFYMDLYHDKKKQLSSPICIHLCHNYNDMNDKGHPTKVVLIGNFNKQNDKCISHADIVSLFREMGNAIQFFSYQTNTGLMFFTDDFYLLTSKIMEHFAWEKSFLMKICENNNELVDHVLFTRFIDFGNSLKLRCANAYFDHIIHNNTDVIKKLRSSGECSGNFFRGIYVSVYENIFNSQKDFFETCVQNIHPIVISQTINGSETSIYENILVEILSFSAYNLIKKKEGKKYMKILSKANTDTFKDTLNKFVSKLGDNYNFYLNELIGYNEIDTEMNVKIKKESYNKAENMNYKSDDINTSANYFDVKSTDHENTFFIDKKLDIEND